MLSYLIKLKTEVLMVQRMELQCYVCSVCPTSKSITTYFWR